MLKLFIAILGLLSLATDLVVYRQLSKRFPERKRLKKGYLVFFIAMDIFIVLALALVRSKFATTGNLTGLMWVIWVFIVFNTPKVTYLIVSWPDYFIRKYGTMRFRIFSLLGAVAAVTVLGIELWGTIVTRNTLDVRGVVVESNKIPASFDDYKIVQISDLHLGVYSNGNRLIEKMCVEINSLEPDLIVMTGDIVNSCEGELDGRSMKVLSGLRAKDGVFAVLGNHDLGYYIFDDSLTPEQNTKLLSQKIDMMGWNLLSNSSTYIVRGSDSISLSGVNFHIEGDAFHGKPLSSSSKADYVATYQGVDRTKFNILLSHTPKYWDEILAGGYSDLTLSGHLHSMQFKINLGKRGWSPAKWMYGRWSGLYAEQGSHLYINDGIGFAIYPMRIGSHPEITVLTLRRTE